MRSWHKRVIVDTAKALVPCKQQIRQVLRRVSHYRTDPAIDNQLFGNILNQIEMLRAAGFDICGKRILEIGSGWHPIAAMTFLAAGAKSVTLTDIERLLDPHLIRTAINFVITRKETLIERLGCAHLGRLKMVQGGAVHDMVAGLGLEYFVPYKTELSAVASADLIVSCSVFEHIKPVILETMVSDFRRIIAPGGAMIHFIDCSDHYAQADRSISRCNFLRYEEWAWRLLSLNPQNFHNRLRYSDFAQLFRRNGFRIVSETRILREKEKAEVAKMALASRFMNRDIDDLATVGAKFVVTAD